MKVLFISTRSPLPTIDGGSLRTYNVLRSIALHHEVFYASIVKHREEHKYKNDLEKICKCVDLVDINENMYASAMYASLLSNMFSRLPFVAIKYDSKRMRNIIDEVLTKYDIDIVHLESLPMGCYLDILNRHHVILSTHNVESSLLSRRVQVEKNPLAKLFWKSQQQRLQRFEIRCIMKANTVLTCSDADKALFEAMAPGCNCKIIPNGVDIDFFTPVRNAHLNCDKIVFVGGMNWFPNRDAIEWFDNSILEFILKSRSHMQTHVVGKCDSSLTLRHGNNFLIHGYVDDIRPFVADAAVFICPIRVGGGTRLKLLDAMAMGKAIVSTTIGAEGLDVTNGEQMLLADTAQAFANAVLTLLNNAELRATLGSNARAFVEQKYSWERIGHTLLNVYDDTVDMNKAKTVQRN